MTATVWQPVNAFMKARRAELKAEYPDATKDEMDGTLLLESERWFSEVQRYETGAVVPAGVMRSFVAILGRDAARRAFRHVGNRDDYLKITAEPSPSERPAPENQP